MADQEPKIKAPRTTVILTPAHHAFLEHQKVQGATHTDTIRAALDAYPGYRRWAGLAPDPLEQPEHPAEPAGKTQAALSAARRLQKRRAQRGGQRR